MPGGPADLWAHPGERPAAARAFAGVGRAVVPEVDVVRDRAAGARGGGEAPLSCGDLDRGERRARVVLTLEPPGGAPLSQALRAEEVVEAAVLLVDIVQGDPEGHALGAVEGEVEVAGT